MGEGRKDEKAPKANCLRDIDLELSIDPRFAWEELGGKLGKVDGAALEPIGTEPVEQMHNEDAARMDQRMAPLVPN